MINLKMFCLTLEPTHKEFIKQLGYIPVGLGEKKFHNLTEWFTDKPGISISEKNKNYGEYTFHYWLWKNYIDLKEVEDGWFGFCQYRKYWSNENEIKSIKNLKDLNNQILKEIHNKYDNFDSILSSNFLNNVFRRIRLR